MSLKRKATDGIVWTFSQQFGNQIIGFVVSIILARLLLPSEFGLVGMIAIFIAVGKVLIDSGFTQSIIRSKNLDQEDYSTIFFFNLGISFILYLVLFITAPLISSFYNNSLLISILRIFGITFIINAFTSIQKTRLTKQMDFRTQTLVALPSTILGGLVGILLAYYGFGVWSLVWGSLASSFLSSLQLWIYSKWTPSLVFNIEKFKTHFSFGYKIAISALIDTLFNNLYLLVIGKFFSPSQVGYYVRAESTKNLPVTNIASALNKVTYPMFAEIQDDNIRLKRVYKQLMKMVILVVAPILIIMAVLGEPIFNFLFGEKWLPAVPFFQILCITGILRPIQSYNLNVLKVKGRSDLFLRLEIIKKIIVVLTIIIALQFGILAILYGQIFTSIVAFIINSHYTGTFINYGTWEQVKDILPSLISSCVTGLVVYLWEHRLMPDSTDFVIITTGVSVGIFIYISLAFISQRKLLRIIKNLFSKG